jgi:GNAT superfamily N-acetyltransferase
MDVTIRPLGPETFDDFVSLHARPECGGCYCTYWHFAGDNRAWQLSRPEDNAALKRDLVARGATHGLLAYARPDPGLHRDADELVGTIQFEPRDALPKLTARMPYRGLPPDGATWGVTCFRVREDARRRGVARALLAATLAHLRDAHGATAVEAYPRRGDDLRDDEVWTGPESLFASAGFVVVRDHTQYPVLRRALP